jgi:hypothetical protein
MEHIQREREMEMERECALCVYYGLDDRGVGVPVPFGSRIFSSHSRPDWLWGPSNLLYNRYRGLLLQGLKRQELEVDHSHPNTADVKKTWIYTSTSPYALMA